MFGASKSSEKVFAVADIGSGSAAVAIVALKSGAPAHIIATSRVVLPFEDRTEAATMKGVVASLADAAKKALTQYQSTPYAKIPISGSYAILRAPWTHSKTLRATSQLEKSVKVTDAMINKLAQQALVDDASFDHDKLLEASVIRVELNGYPTATPVGKVASMISVAALVSEYASDIKDDIISALHQITIGATPVLRSGTHALLSVTQELSDLADGYLILDMATEGTNMVSVREGLATEHAVIPEGVRSILIRLGAKSLPEETLGLLRMIEREESSTEASTALKDAIARTEPDLARVFGEAMMKISAPRRLPNDMILVAHPDMAPWLLRFLGRIDFAQFTETSQPFRVHILDAKDVSTLVTSEDIDIVDTGLSIACGLVNREATH